MLSDSISLLEADAFCIFQLNSIVSGVPYDEFLVSGDPRKVNGFHPVEYYPGSSRLEICLGSEAMVVA